MKVVTKFRNMSFEERCIVTVKFSIIFNSILALGKFGLAIFNQDVFFFVAGVINIFMMISKLECYSGIKLNNNQYSKNTLVAIFRFIRHSIYYLYG